MKQIDRRLIVSDFDGTLLSTKYDIPQRTRRAVAEYVSCGGVFAIATGRMLCSILPRARELGLKGIVIAYQGSVIADIESGKILKFGGFSAHMAAEALRAIEQQGESCQVYCDEKLYIDLPEDNPHLQLYEKITGVKAINVLDRPLSRFIEEKGRPCQKVASLVAPQNRARLYSALSEKLSSRFDVTCSANVLVEVSPLGDDKGQGLKFLAEYYGIPLSSSVAIGDNLNDASMLKAAGIGVAVANSSAELKAVADEITLSNDECGVAEIIYKYGFKS